MGAASVHDTRIERHAGWKRFACPYLLHLLAKLHLLAFWAARLAHLDAPVGQQLL